MDANAWQRVEELYYRISSAPPEARSALLNEACPGDPELRSEVEALLQANDQVGDFLSPEGLVQQMVYLAPEPVASRIGTTLGSYEIVAALGSGAMGEVYRARDTRLGRNVALKVLPAHVMHDASRIARFQSEARAASSLNHPNAVTIYEIGNDAGTWFIAAELIDGITLRQRIQAGQVPAGEAISIALQCASCLDEAHRAGILHRDVKPENIMLRPDGVAKVVDFGLARIMESREGSAGATQTGSIMGTPRYMSPEQARGLKLDARSDVFSLGAVLYEMLGGRPAFPGSTAAEVFAALLHSDPAGTGDDVRDAAVLKALAKDPAGRYATMEEFAAALRAGTQERRVSPIGKQVSHRRVLKGIAPALVTLALGGLGFFVWTAYRDGGREHAPHLVPLTAAGGDKRDVTLSPDGSRIAFSWTPPGKDTFHIYTMKVGQNDPVQLTFSPSHDGRPAWSPDGKSIAFCREGNPNAVPVPQEILVIPADGGKERKIVEGWHGVSWSPDQKALALAHLPRGASSSSQDPESGGIFVLSLDGGTRRELTASHRDRYPQFSPNGKWIAFVRDVSDLASEIFVIRSSGGPATQLTFDRQEMRGMTWTTDSRELIFASSRSGADGSLWRVSVNGGAPRPVSSTLRDASEPNVAQGASRLAYKEQWIDTNIYLLTSEGFSEHSPGRFGPPSPVVHWTREEHSPALSPDGERLAFVSNRSGNQEIWVSRRDGSQATQLTSLRAQNTGSPRWSPDGRWIAFDSWSSGDSDIYVIASGGGTPRVVTAERSGSWMPAWSPDGEWIYFSRGLYVMREIWKIPAAGGAATQLTHTGAFEAVPSPDGKLVYFTKQVNGPECAIWSVPAAGGAEKPVPELAPFKRISRGWGVTQQGIYFISFQDLPQQTVRLLSFQTRRITPLVTLEKQVQWGVPFLTLSPDGRYIAMVQLDHSVNDFMMIENFR